MQISAAEIVLIRQRIGNPVRVRNGTATVYEEAHTGRKVSHWDLFPEKVVCWLKIHESGDLLIMIRFIEDSEESDGLCVRGKRLR